MKNPFGWKISGFYTLCLVLLSAGNAGAWQMKQAPLMTRWAAQVDTNSPLPEYPRPQLVRTDWMSLNGLWQFQPGATNDPVPAGRTLSSEILVPFPMESAISGVMQYSEFSWYRRTFTVPAAWTGRHIILHLDAVNWRATVYVNGQQVGVHKGGYDAISYDITSYLNGGANELIVQVYSPEDAAGEPRGKQTLYPGGIMYTSSSGIWQPAWLEPVDPSGVSDLRIIPDVDNSRLRLTVNTYNGGGTTVTVNVVTNGTVVASAVGSPQTELDLSIPHPILWSPDNPFLYDLQISIVHSGVTNDAVTSYFGMRKIALQTVNGVPEIYLNNQPYFEMGPLDQGFWPDGIYTAPTDEALAYDLQMEKTLGFNMVRKHIKVERQRWYYWADKLGLLVWQDMPSCNSYTGNPTPPAVDAGQFITELTNMVTQHWNSPAIMMWDVFNEAQGQQDTSGGVGQSNTAYLVQLVKTTDPSRLVNQASGGNYYGVGDVLDSHSYPPPGNPQSTTQAPVDGEYGGIGFQMAGHLWNPALAGGNYVGANTTNDIASIYDTFSGDLVFSKSTYGLNAAVYTQITDVENECNGLMTYDRFLKPALNLINASNQKARQARANYVTLLPTSQAQGRTWKYTTATPPANWYAVNFAAAGWSSGLAGFGTAETPGAVVRTTWNTSDIWIRQTFTLGALSPLNRTQLFFYVYHDEDCEIYLNGVLAGSATGYATTYVQVPMNAAGQNALIANGTNVIAVHCHQTSGGQNIDVGISWENLIMNAYVVPTDEAGYWALDETSGATAGDSTGNGDSGVVNNAVWDPAGKINGCLDFNGQNSSVSVANVVSNDFSISFWLKTTQAAATGSWWAGRGLVDGFVAAGANDFGTALSGGDFAFGAGNPDTTVVSAMPVNDGVWHQCVATRQQSTGALAVYVDGALAAVGVGGTNSLTAAAGLRFGARQTGANFFQGRLDDIRIYSRVLGSNEVAALYADSAAPAPAPANLVATPGNNLVNLNWDSLPAVAGYDLRRATNPAGPFVSIATLVVPGYADSAVTNGTTYYYAVAAMNSLGDGAGAGPVPATPSLAAAVKSWFQADAIPGLANGAAVADWPDASGNGADATQTNADLQPVYVAGAMNGLPVVRFHSANSNYLAFPRAVQDDFTILCVFRSSQAAGSGDNFFDGGGVVNGEMPGAADDFGTSLNASGQILAGTGNPDTTVVSATGYADGHAHEFTFKRTAATGALALYVDGTLAGTATGGSQSLLAPNRLVLGAQQTLVQCFDGDIAEVKIFNTVLTDDARVTEENHLLYKWGIRPVPAVKAGVSARLLQLSWPVSAAGWGLFVATNLTAPIVWLPVTNLWESNGTQFTLNLPFESGARFFRLVGP